MTSDDPDVKGLERLLDVGGRSLQPTPPHLTALNARVHRVLRRRRIMTVVTGASTASVAVALTVISLNPSPGTDTPASSGRSGFTNQGMTYGERSAVTQSTPSSSTRTPMLVSELCDSPETFILSDYEPQASSHAHSPLEAAQHWALSGESLRVVRSPNSDSAFVVFQSLGKPPRQVLHTQLGERRLWTITQTAACLDSVPRGPGCGQAVKLKNLTYDRTVIRAGEGPGVGRLLGQGLLPVCVRELSPSRHVLGPRGPVAPVSIFAYMEVPSSHAVTVSVTKPSGTHEIRVYLTK